MKSPFGNAQIGAGWGPPAGLSSIIAARVSNRGGGAGGSIEWPRSGNWGNDEEENKRLRNGDKASQAWLEYMGPEFQKRVKMSPADFKLMSAEDKIAFMDGTTKAIALAEDAEKRRAQEEEAGAVPAFMREMTGPSGPPDGMMDGPGLGPTPAPQALPDPWGQPAEATGGRGAPRFDPSRMMDVVSRMPPRQAAVMGRMLLPQLMKADDAPRTLAFKQDPLGNWITQSPETGAFQYAPGQIMGSELTPMKDPMTGELVSYVRQSGPNSYATVPLPKEEKPKSVPASFYNERTKLLDMLALKEGPLNKTDKELKEIYNQDPNATRAAIKKEVETLKTRLNDHFDLYESQSYGTPEFWQKVRKQDGVTPAANIGDKGTQGKALPIPKKESEMVRDAVYRTSRGPAKWNGTYFIPVK